MHGILPEKKVCQKSDNSSSPFDFHASLYVTMSDMERASEVN